MLNPGGEVTVIVIEGADSVESHRDTKTGTEPVSWNNGAPGEIRTPDHLVRSQVLYPAELRALKGCELS